MSTFHYRFHAGRSRSVEPDVVEGSGRVRSRVLSLPSAPRIHVTGGFSVALAVDPELRDGVTLRLRADDNVLPRIHARCRDGRIAIELEAGRYRDLTELSVAATVGPLTQITAAGTARVVARNLDASAVTLASEGESAIYAEGRAVDWFVVASGSGQVSLVMAHARRVSLDVDEAALVCLRGRADAVDVRCRNAGRVRAVAPEFEARRAGIELRGASMVQVRARECVAGRVRFPARLFVSCDGQVAVDGSRVHRA